MDNLRPYVLVNIAATADGKIDTIARRGAPISSPLDWQRVDRLRADSDAVMVGGRTLLDEDPRLLVKSSDLQVERVQRGQSENPIKVGVVSEADLRDDSRFLHQGNASIIIFTTQRTESHLLSELESAGAQVIVMGQTRVDLEGALQALYARGVRRLMVEGGGTLIGELFRLGLVDELYIYIAPLIFGGATAPTLADGAGMEWESAVKLRLEGVTTLPEGGIVTHYLVGQKVEE